MLPRLRRAAASEEVPATGWACPRGARPPAATPTASCQEPATRREANSSNAPLHARGPDVPGEAGHVSRGVSLSGAGWWAA